MYKKEVCLFFICTSQYSKRTCSHIYEPPVLFFAARFYSFCARLCGFTRDVSSLARKTAGPNILNTGEERKREKDIDHDFLFFLPPPSNVSYRVIETLIFEQ